MPYESLNDILAFQHLQNAQYQLLGKDTSPGMLPLVLWSDEAQMAKGVTCCGLCGALLPGGTLSSRAPGQGPFVWA